MEKKQINMKSCLLILISIIFLNFLSCKNDNLEKKPKNMIIQEAESDSTTLISQFERDVRKFKEFEPYMIDDIPLSDEYSEYFKNPELYLDAGQSPLNLHY